MSEIIVEERYKFVPPREGSFYPFVIGTLLPWIVKKDYGVDRMSFVGLEKIREAHQSGKAVMLAANHCRPVDPMIVAAGCRRVGLGINTVASWHLFKQNAWQGFILPRLGVFSIYREGLDRESLKCCAEILFKGTRPLLIFPEGVINRTNDRVGDFLEGVGMIARMGAKQRKDKSVTIFPVALRYTFRGNLENAVLPVLDSLEKGLCWADCSRKTIRSRVDSLAQALLCLKEIEHLGCPGSGSPGDRVKVLSDHLLSKNEVEWMKSRREGGTKCRVKNLRTAIVPHLVKEGVPAETVSRVRKTLADVALAQQLENYCTDYFSPSATETQILETVEKFEEDLRGTTRTHAPFEAKMTVCEPVVVGESKDTSEALAENLRGSIVSSLASDHIDFA